MFLTENGVSSTQTGLLTREVVLNTKAERPVDLDRSYYKRLIGGNLFNVKQLGHIFKKAKPLPQAEEANKDAQPDRGSGMSASSLAKHKIRRFVKK
jgi:hypothetical protein